MDKNVEKISLHRNSNDGTFFEKKTIDHSNYRWCLSQSPRWLFTRKRTNSPVSRAKRARDKATWSSTPICSASCNRRQQRRNSWSSPRTIHLNAKLFRNDLITRIRGGSGRGVALLKYGFRGENAQYRCENYAKFAIPPPKKSRVFTFIALDTARVCGRFAS